MHHKALNGLGRPLRALGASRPREPRAGAEKSEGWAGSGDIDSHLLFSALGRLQ